MDDTIKASYERNSKELRADLKKWESDWAAGHNGSKPSRQDIKDNPNIAAKYKEYNKTRDILAGKIPLPAPTQQLPNPKKRRPDPPPTETPLKKNRYAETPSKNRTLDENDFMSTPAISRKLFSPAPVTSIGPTPQRDGKVLGLFDLLVGKELGTPSKSTEKQPPSTPGGRRRREEDATPSRRRGSLDSEKLGRTPMSSSKRQMLNTFMTPLKNRDAGAGGNASTPGSVSKLQFDTPAFLRRHTLPALSEGVPFDAPAPLKLPRKPLGRGLSEIVASLRKVEDDHLDDDDDMAALRELEDADMDPSAAGSAPSVTAPAAASQSTAPKERDILARDRESHNLPLGGFDDEGLYDSPDEADRTGRNGQPLVVYKKKGQKRTTRRVNMRPTITKRPTESLGGSQDIIPETQQLDGQENADEDYEDVEETDGKKKRPMPKEGVVKKSVRKVNELAHANFRRLKLRSKNMKGKSGGRRFGRRR
ncbi:DNA replication regulator SLD2 [Akanthomyces lecanii RCEF 1005]|uniref:DNA replication regulator SLD2 n=1 Tax=Akanthomyces lecanii RCEF 1005 TaxID=1081108 RepID=A0A168H569_CORDF|nr:DNA replication regulator SLD2 [Akanthomyces lecanii RCEF 1005]